MPSRKLTAAGSCPPSCKYLWTASRPVNRTPEISTESPTLSARVFSSVKGLVSWIIKTNSIEPLFYVATGCERHSLPAKGPTHIADTHKIRSRQPVGRDNLYPQQS